MQDHQRRVIEEERELTHKILRLRSFIGLNPAYRELPEQEQSRLNRQLEAMGLYAGILAERIAAFEGE